MKRLTGLVFTVLIYVSTEAQTNSPYSRYGLGDVVQNHNIATRGMGSIAAGYSDFQNLNFTNPANYANLSYISPEALRLNPSLLRSTVFEFGAEFTNLTLKSVSPSENFSSKDINIPYIEMGIPIKMLKANRKGIFLGANFGLKPANRISYKIAKFESEPGIDSIGTVYEGSGGLNEAVIGVGLRVRNLSFGIDIGHAFGRKEYTTNLKFFNDTAFYFSSSTYTNTSLKGAFFNAGLQYEIKLKSKALIVLGGYGRFQQTLRAGQDNTSETVYTDVYGQKVRVDSVFSDNIQGQVIRPATYGGGFTYRDGQGHWLFGADYEFTQWDKYRFYGQPDSVTNSYKVRAGVEYYPATSTTPLKNYFSFVKYRFGFNFGPDYVKVNNTPLPQLGISLGAGFPLKLKRSYFETQSSQLNTSIEFGTRGDKKSNLTENTVRISIGFSMSDLWFRRYKYD
jgi:hypothetical protein